MNVGRRLVVALAAATVAGCGGGTSVTAYCEYGAVSEAQLEGCIDHVTVDEIDGRNTNAARYARGELDQCRADAGPFCRD